MSQLLGGVSRRRAIISFAVFIGVWELLAGVGVLNPRFYSSPVRIVVAFYEEIQRARYWNDVRISSLELLYGYFAAVAIGVPFGLATGASRRLGYFFRPWIDGLNATPRVAFYPVVVLWVGLGMASKVVLVFMGSFFSIAINTASGVRTVDPRFLNVARGYHASRTRTFLTVVLPATVPFIVAGMRIAIHRALIGVIIGELFGATAGVGYMLRQAAQNLQTERLFVGAFTFTIMGLLLFKIVSAFEGRFQRWKPAPA